MNETKNASLEAAKKVTYSFNQWVMENKELILQYVEERNTNNPFSNAIDKSVAPIEKLILPPVSMELEIPEIKSVTLQIDLSKK